MSDLQPKAGCFGGESDSGLVGGEIDNCVEDITSLNTTTNATVRGVRWEAENTSEKRMEFPNRKLLRISTTAYQVFVHEVTEFVSLSVAAEGFAQKARPNSSLQKS